MSFIRVKKDANFTMIQNTTLRDKNLSLKAKGLLAQMLSFPDNWKFSLKGLCRMNKESETAIRSAVNELKENHYLDIKRQSTKNGYVYDWVVYEVPYDSSAKDDVSECPKTPCVENVTLKNTVYNNTVINNTDDNNYYDEKEKLSTHLTYMPLATEHNHTNASACHNYATDLSEIFGDLDPYENHVEENVDFKPENPVKEEKEELVEKVDKEKKPAICKRHYDSEFIRDKLYPSLVDSLVDYTYDYDYAKEWADLFCTFHEIYNEIYKVNHPIYTKTKYFELFVGLMKRMVDNVYYEDMTRANWIYVFKRYFKTKYAKGTTKSLAHFLSDGIFKHNMLKAYSEDFGYGMDGDEDC